jgi:hypothetical protein
MVSWAEFEERAPELAREVRARFDAHGHKTMATLRRDGSPRISGTEVTLKDGELWVGGMPGSQKCRDLQRDPRLAIHSGSDEPKEWKGDAKVAGRAVEVTDPETKRSFTGSLEDAPPGPFRLFRLDLTEATAVRLGQPADHLVVEWWTPEGGVRRVERR